MAEVSLEGMSQEAISGLAMIAKGLSDNPATRNDFLKLTKTANPHLAIPEVDLPLQINNSISAEREKIAALEKELLKDRVERDVERRRESLMENKGLNKADIAEVEKLMVEKNIASHETAADFYNMQRQSAKPTPFSGHGSHQMPKIEAKDFGGNIAQWARNEAAQTIHGIKTGVIKV